MFPFKAYFIILLKAPPCIHFLCSDPNCGDKLTCIARSGKWEGQKICVEEKFICDNTLQCMGGEDEDEIRFGCKEKYFEKNIFKKSEQFVCHRTFKYLSEPFSDLRDTLKISTAIQGTSTTSTPTTICDYDDIFSDNDCNHEDIATPRTSSTSAPITADDYDFNIFGDEDNSNEDTATEKTFATSRPTTVSDNDDYDDYDDYDIFGRKRRRRKRDTKEGNKKRKKFFPYRAVECDGAKQCPHGEDEAACDIDLMAIIFLGILSFIILQSEDFNSRGCFWFPCLCHFYLLIPPCSHLWKGSPSREMSSSGVHENQVGNIQNMTNSQASTLFKVVHY